MANVVTEAVGDPILEMPSLYAGYPYTNLALHSSDLTDVVWIKTGATIAPDTGLTGEPNSGSTVTATAANATVLQTITLAASDTHLVAFLKRVTGTGTVEITIDGGAVWTAVSLTSSYQDFTFRNSSIANPEFGIRITTSGDEVSVGNVMVSVPSPAVSVGAMIGLSPLVTQASTATYTATTAHYDIGNYSPAQHMYYSEVTKVSTPNLWSVGSVNVSANGRILTNSTYNILNVYDGTNSLNLSGVSLQAGETIRIATAYDASQSLMTTAYEGIYSPDNAYDGDFNATTNLLVMGASNSGLPLTASNGVPRVKNLQGWDLDYTAAKEKMDELFS